MISHCFQGGIILNMSVCYTVCSAKMLKIEDQPCPALTKVHTDIRMLAVFSTILNWTINCQNGQENG
jgi:hypothetical protein